MPGNENRLIRIAQEMQIQLARLIETEVRDPRLGIVTVTEVKVTRDLAHAKVFFVVRDEQTKEASLKVLSKASGFLRRALATEILLRVIPELHFHYDESSVYGQRIDQLLRDVSDDASTEN